MDLIYTRLLTEEIKSQIKDQAFACPEEETCGLIVENNSRSLYYACKNNAIDRHHHFSISGLDYLNAQKYGEIKAVCHAQVERKDCSYFDAENAFGHKLPFILYCKKTDAFSFLIKPNIARYSTYLNRPFRIGENDCFSLVRDFYKNELGIQIRNVQRRELWFEENPNLLKDTARLEGFHLFPKTTEKEIYDILVYKSELQKLPMHLGIYLGTDEFLHHPRIGGSRIDRIHLHESNLIYVARK